MRRLTNQFKHGINRAPNQFVLYWFSLRLPLFSCAPKLMNFCRQTPQNQRELTDLQDISLTAISHGNSVRRWQKMANCG
jgi:hypothetical protein